MKLALMALVIEIFIVRIFISSWKWAAVIVGLYCILVYIWQTILTKKQKRTKSGTEYEDIWRQDSISGSKKRKRRVFNIDTDISASQKN